MGAIIRSVGIYLPERELTNQHLEKILAASGQETSDEWITQRTGIRKRRIAAAYETPGTMAVESAKDAIRRLKKDIPPIEHILIASNSSERLFPNISGLVQAELIKDYPNMIAKDAGGSDPHAGCGGINQILEYADALIRVGFYRTVLAIGTEKLSAITDYSDRGTCVLFGDGATAYLISGNAEDAGFMGHYSRGNGTDREDISCEEDIEKVSFEEALRILRDGGAPQRTKGRVLKMNGRAVYRYVEREWQHLIETFKDNFKLNPEGISFDRLAAISPHLANFVMLDNLDDDYPEFLKKCQLNKNGDNEHFCNNSTASQGRRDLDFIETAAADEYLLKFGYGAELLSCANLYKQVP